MATQIVHQAVPVPQVVPFPATTPQVTQSQLERVIQLRNAVAAFKEHLAKAEAEVQAQLESGGAIESGTHVASLKESFRRNVPWREVAERLADRAFGEGRGAGYCENVLGNTHPSKSVSLVVS